jgi:hypothetical protein
MFVGGHALRSELAANPGKFFGENDLQAIPGPRECCGNPANAGTNDHEIGFQFPGRTFSTKSFLREDRQQMGQWRNG